GRRRRRRGPRRRRAGHGHAPQSRARKSGTHEARLRRDPDRRDAPVRLGTIGWVMVTLLVILHLALHVVLGLGRSAPDLMTVALLIGARDLRIGWAAGLGLVIGLLEDALSVLVFGASALTMTVLGILGASTRELFVGDSRLFVVSYFFAGKWLRDALQWVMMGEEIRGPFVDQVVVQGLLGALYVAVIGVAIAAFTGLSSEA